MEGCNEGLCLLGCTYGTLRLDSDDWGIGCGSFCGSGVLLGAVSGDMSLLVAMEAESTLDPLLLFFVSERSSGLSSSNVHSVWVAIVECVPPLEFCCSSPSFTSFDSFFEVYVFLLVGTGGVCPVIPCDQMVELYTVGD